MPDTVLYMGSGVFFCCTDLKEVKLSSSIISIRRGTFAGCGSLDTINAPDNVKSIGRCAFAIHSLVHVLLPDALKHTARGIFDKYVYLHRIVLPKKLVLLCLHTFDE